MIASSRRPDAETLPVRTLIADLHDQLAALGERYDAVPLFPQDSLTLLAHSDLNRRYAPVASEEQGLFNGAG